MTIRYRLFAITLLLAAGTAMAQKPYMHIFRKESGKTRVNSFEAEKVGEVTHTADKSGEAFDKVAVKTADGSTTSVSIADLTKVKIGTEVPTFYITTDNASLTEVQSKEYYVTGTVSMEGHGVYDDLAATTMNIRGRGNSTWNLYPKKPYRVKFDSKVKLCGLKKAKNYIFIANYIDNTLLRNAFALKAAELLGMPYTNHPIPVEIYFNGIYKGAYMMTEKVGINGASVDIDDNEGIMWELDTNYDETYKFKSSVYGLPVMVKDPDFDELAAADGATMTASQLLAKWKADFQEFENTLKSGSTKDFADYLDIESLVDYFIVCNLAKNEEPHHPKSVYLYKEKAGEKYKLGPVWDFDWAYTWSSPGNNASATKRLLADSGLGTSFFKKMLSDSRVQALYKQKWAAFKAEKLPELWAFFDEYADMVESSAARNGVTWTASSSNTSSTDTFPENVETLRSWIQQRIAFIDSASNFGLY